MNLSILDISVIIAYFIVILVIGFVIAGRYEKTQDSKLEFLLAGRNVTLPFFVATLVATWYGTILGVGELIYKFGIVEWLCLAFPYYIAAFFFAKFVARKIRKSGSYTIPEQITTKYGKEAGWISAFVVLVITIPASYILMLGVMLSLFFDLSLEINIIIGAILSLAYIYTGGLKANILTNSAQFIIMYIGFAILLFYAMTNLGSVENMLDKIPDKHKELTGGLNWQYIFSWFIISLQTFVDPSFHQRCAAAKSSETAKKGIYVSIIFWIIFDLMTLSTGLYAKAFVITDNPMMSYPLLAEMILPSICKGIFIISLLSIIMSTLNSYAFLSAATVGNDILKPLQNKFHYLNNFSTTTLVRIGLIVTTFIAVILAILLPSAIDLIYKTSSIAIPGLIIPLLVSYSEKYRLTSKKVIIMMILSTSVSLFWTIMKSLSSIKLFKDFEPMTVGIIISIILFLIFYKKVDNV